MSRPSVAVVIAVYNEEENLPRLLDALRAQTLPPDEIIVVDDGSTDSTPRILRESTSRLRALRPLFQGQRGPAAARNLGWRSATSEICVFTDGDCVPKEDWLEKLILPFAGENVGGAGGMYRTQNTSSTLARFIGWEIAWRYRNIGEQIDAHGTYNLALRRSMLEALGGFNESFRKPSGEDFDLTYKVSRKARLLLVREAVVGHYHPDHLPAFLTNQVQRGEDRARLYLQNPDKIKGDTFTGKSTKYAVASSFLFPVSLALIPASPVGFGVVSASLFLFLAWFSFHPFPYIARRDVPAALYGLPVRFIRVFAWAYGFAKGLAKLSAARKAPPSQTSGPASGPASPYTSRRNRL